MTNIELAGAFRQAEASLRVEGLDLSGRDYYEAIKARMITGEITAAEGKAEIVQYHQQARAYVVS
ncbi:MAG: hypothetical protein ON057_001753 [Glomeribacter sp. 1016415]|nr:hypothetical protein [Glomeribacter sp. 1016415]